MAVGLLVRSGDTFAQVVSDLIVRDTHPPQHGVHGNVAGAVLEREGALLLVETHVEVLTLPEVEDRSKLTVVGALGVDARLASNLVGELVLVAVGDDGVPRRQIRNVDEREVLRLVDDATVRPFEYERAFDGVLERVSPEKSFLLFVGGVGSVVNLHVLHLQRPPLQIEREDARQRRHGLGVDLLTQCFCVGEY